MALRSIYLAFLLIFCCTVKAQLCVTLSGRVTDSVSLPLQSVIVVLMIDDKKKFAVSDNKGNYSIKYCYTNDTVVLTPVNLSFKLIGYLEKEMAFTPRQGTNLLADVKLYSTIKQLNEVIVKNRAITQRGDTTSFTLGAFKNKMDGNLEDVLKRMPGFDVDESGKILYDNKPIETILIEGDELAKNYKLISKNIPPDAIDKLELISKYEANPLLKGLTGSRKQAINLTLKNPNHVSTFGNLKAGVGIEEKFNLSGNLFGINKQFKTMLLGNANNIGVNPYEEITFDQRSIQNKEYEFDNTLVQNQIDENPLFSRPLFSTVTNNLFNNSRMATVNGSLRISNTLSAKLFSDLYSDRINQGQLYYFYNNISPAISYKTNTQKTFLPRVSNFYVQFKFLKSKEQLLLTAIASQKKYGEQDTITSTMNYRSDQNSLYNRKGVAAYYTNRIDSSHLFEFSLQYTRDSKSQDYNILQDTFRSINSVYIADHFLEQTIAELDYLKAEARYLFKKNKTAPAELRITNTFFNARLASSLWFGNGSAGLTPADFLNDGRIKNNKLQLLASKEFIFKKISAGGGAGLALFNNLYEFTAAPEIYSHSVLPVLNLNVRYRFGSYSEMNYGLDYNSSFPGILTVNQNPILNAFRTFTQRIPWSTNIPYLQSNLTYLYKNINTGTSFIAAWVYFNQKSSEISNIKFAKDFDSYTMRFSDTSQDQHTIFIKFDKYISRLKSSFNFKQSLSWFSRPLESNNTIVSSRNFGYSATASFKPTITNALSLNGGVNINYTKDIQSSKSTYQLGPFINTIAGVTERLSVGLNCAYYTDNYSFSNNSYWFAGSYLWYTAKHSKFDVKLTVNNLFNTTSILTGSRNDLYSQYSELTILPRFALLELIYKF